jgi:hypothetical protein
MNALNKIKRLLSIPVRESASDNEIAEWMEVVIE